MLNKVAIYFILLFGFLAFFQFSCSPIIADDRPLPPDSAYFSIKSFIKDQIEINQGQPISLIRVSTLNGTKDSSMTNLLTMNWAPIFDVFNESDIASRKYLGQYAFSQFDDNITGTHSFVYTAKNPKLYTRQLQISIDPFSNKITSIYIETARKNFWTSSNKKLLFIPHNIIQIQEHEGYFIGKDKSLIVEIRFPETESNIESGI